MKFPVSKLDIKKYHNKINSLIKDDECKIFIDTNIIALFYGIHDSARKELFDWLRILIQKDRLKVPVWVINEYTNRFIRDKIQDYLGPLKKISTIRKEFKGVSDFLKMHIEDSNLNGSKYSTISEFQDDLDEIKNKLDKIAFAAKVNDQKSKLKIHDEISNLLEKCIIESDVDKTLTVIDSIGKVRYNHRLPPGFQDGNKDLNSYGDLILWYEILDYCKKERIKKVILITNDEKKDWVYTPAKKIIDNGKEIPNTNPEIKITDPRLVHEFKLNTESEEFYIISFELFTKILINNVSRAFINLAQSLQLVHNQIIETDTNQEIEDEFKNDLTEFEDIENVHKKSTDAISNSQNKEIEKDTNQVNDFIYSSYALADKDFPLIENTYFTNTIEQLKSYNWYTQNPAIDSLLEFNSKKVEENQSNIDSIFVIGRNIYQTAVGGSRSAVSFIKNISYRFKKYTDFFINHLYSGIVYEIYFDSSNIFRGQKLKSYYINEVFVVFDLERLKPSTKFIKKVLQKYEGRLFYLPYENEKVTITINFYEKPIFHTEWLDNEVGYWFVKEIKIKEIDILTSDTEKVIDIYYPRFQTISDLAQYICTIYGIPLNQYIIENNIDISQDYEINLGNKGMAKIN